MRMPQRRAPPTAQLCVVVVCCGCALGWGNLKPLSIDEPSERSRAEMVVCRYSENISWLSYMPPTDFWYTIQNKGEPLNASDYGPRSTVVTLPNKGTEGYCYVRHIVDNYDSLANVTVFTQAGILHHGGIGPSGSVAWSPPLLAQLATVVPSPTLRASAVADAPPVPPSQVCSTDSSYTSPRTSSPTDTGT